MKNESAGKIKILYVVIAVLLLAGVIIGIAEGFIYYRKQAESAATAARLNNPAAKGVKIPGKGIIMGMVATTPSPLTNQQEQQLTDEVSTKSKKKTFNITGGNFYFVPNVITVNKGDQVTFIFNNAGGVHDLVIDELSVKTPIIQTGESYTVTFAASNSGSFIYYCSFPGHRNRGMTGTLTVK